MSANAAKYFENTFGEKSLSIAVNYLTIWTKEQKEKKLVADSLYTFGTQIPSEGMSMIKQLSFSKGTWKFMKI